ncbi:MAG: LamG domain-containing protein, partial [Patescibacteria group bacterium]|nr:LamG domain-containing protein [Patescibacteria group bacterium]
NNGTASNPNSTGMSFVTGKVGNAVQFDGVDDWVEIPYSASLNLSGADETILIWVKHNASGNILFQESGWSRRLGSASWTFYFVGHTSNSITAAVSNDNQYHLVGYTFSNGHLRSYLDGKLIGEKDAVANIEPAGARWWLGRMCGGSSCTYFYTGIIDDLRIYSRALSSEEIMSLYKINK